MMDLTTTSSVGRDSQAGRFATLMTAVITRAISDALKQPASYEYLQEKNTRGIARDAIRFIFTEGAGFDAMCTMVGFNGSDLRRALLSYDTVMPNKYSHKAGSSSVKWTIDQRDAIQLRHKWWRLELANA